MIASPSLSRPTDAVGHVETPTAPVAFTVKPATVDAVLLYTGDDMAVPDRTVRLQGEIGSTDDFVCPVAGRTLAFSLDDDPTTDAGGDGPHALGTAVTDANGVAVTEVSTAGWSPGVYTIAVGLVGGTGCEVSAAEAVLTVGAPGDAVNGAGWYTLPDGRPVHFGFNVTDDSRGKVSVVDRHGWRVEGRITASFEYPGGEGSADGRGALYRWDGGWVLEDGDVPFTVRFSDGGKGGRATDRFGIRIDHHGADLPSSDPAVVEKGRITAAN